jgi:putative SOS response-associated peptidase YedK
MCGRYTATTSAAVLAERFDVEEIRTQERAPSWNVAPTDEVYAIAERRTDDGLVRQLGCFKWGLVPSWSKDMSGAAKMINARSEGLATKPAFRNALARRRCIIPADAFYEWRRTASGKQPFAIAHKDGSPMAFAGLWEVWQEMRTCTIITGPPNQLVAELHDRMPVVLPPDRWDVWLDRDNHDVDELTAMLQPAPAAEFTMWPVSTSVNAVANNGPELVEPVELDAELLLPVSQDPLFPEDLEV